MDLCDQILSGEVGEWPYHKPMDDLWPRGEFWDGPATAFAGLEDSSVLRRLLDLSAKVFSEDDDYFGVIDISHTLKFTSPLLRAIQRRRPENVAILLEQEANRDGVPYEHQVEHARRFRRFCFVPPQDLSCFEIHVSAEDVGTASSQLEPPHLTDEELVERRTTLSQFWTDSTRFVVDRSNDLAQWHSVVKAGTSMPEIFDQLLDAGADITAWCDPLSVSLPQEEEELLPSQLCISTPVHAAIASENHTMLQKLFDSGISPNARALITGNQALTPTQYAIMLGDLESYTILIDNGADSSITTPVFNIHALHFAVAQLRIDLMEAVRLHVPGDAPVTNMGHTLLHIACLPFKRGHVQSLAPKIAKSIHDIRFMSPKYKMTAQITTTYDASGEERLPEFTAKHQERHQRKVANMKYPATPWQWSREPDKDHAKQEAVCKFITATYKDGPQVSDQDKHGNNMLHYLASARCPNISLIEWAKQQEGGLQAWENAKNFWGFTAKDLFEEGEDARNSGRDASYLEALGPWDREWLLSS